MSKSVLETYDPKEELFNAYSHGAGVVMAVVASIFLIIKGSYLPTAQWVGLWVYSFSLILVFTSSTLYHFAQTQKLRYWYKKTRPHCYLLFNCWNIYPVLKHCYTYTKSSYFTYCSLEHCCNWYTFQVSFYSSFSENFATCLCSYGVACCICYG